MLLVTEQFQSPYKNLKKHLQSWKLSTAVVPFLPKCKLNTKQAPHNCTQLKRCSYRSRMDHKKDQILNPKMEVSEEKKMNPLDFSPMGMAQ